MKCKVCGANNEDYLEYCENCAAPLTESADPVEHKEGGAREQRTWDFVASPDWSKPDFSANTVSEDDIPKDFKPQSFRSRFNAPSQETPRQEASENKPAAAASSVRRNSVQTSNPQKRNSVRTYSKASSSIACPNCGATLPDGQRFCNSCGYKLGEPVTAQAASAAPAYASEPAGATAGIKYADPIDDDMFSYNYEEDEDDRPRRKSRKKGPAAKPLVSRPASSRRSRKRGGLALDRSLIFWIVAAVLIVALLVLGAVMASRTYGSLGGFFSNIFNSSPITQEPVVERTVTDSGVPAYNITIYAKRNSIVRFQGGSIFNESPVTGSSIVLNVPEAVWIPSEPIEGETLEVYPDITVISKDGTETPVTFSEPIVINVPTLNISVTSPNTSSFDTASPDVTISGTVDDPTSAVYVNDMQLTVDEAGAFEGTYTLTEEGTQTINVEARKNGYAIARETFTVNYSTAASTGDAAGTTGGGVAAGTIPTGATAVAYATRDEVNIRSEPSSDRDDTVLGTLALNEKVYVIDDDVGNSWASVLYNGSEAYVSNLYIRLVENYTVRDATVTTDNLNGRASASTSSDAVMQLPLNTTVSYIADAGNEWSMIEYDGKIVFVATQYLSIS